MAVRRVLSIFEPSDAPLLRKRSRPVEGFGEETQSLIDDLLDTFSSQAAYGIAAPQIGSHRRVVVVQLAEAQPPLVLVNPRITHAKGELRDYDGCLSIPGIYADTRRAGRIHLEALDRDGKPIRLDLEGFDARVVQHEVDHLDGVLFIDRLDALDDLYRLRREPGAEEATRVPLDAAERERLKRLVRPLPPPALRWRA